MLFHPPRKNDQTPLSWLNSFFVTCRSENNWWISFLSPLSDRRSRSLNALSLVDMQWSGGSSCEKRELESNFWRAVAVKFININKFGKEREIARRKYQDRRWHIALLFDWCSETREQNWQETEVVFLLLRRCRCRCSCYCNYYESVFVIWRCGERNEWIATSGHAAQWNKEPR